MARLTVVTDLTGNVTRETMANIWEDSVFGTLQPSDFALDVFQHEAGDDFRNAPSGESLTPGQFYMHNGDGLMYMFVDEIDSTGVSLWVALGPDRFDAIVCCAEPIPAGAVVEPIFDRWVRIFDPDRTHDTGVPVPPIGIVQTGVPDAPEVKVGAIEPTTHASGTWVAIALEGYCYAWFPSEDSGVSESHFGATPTALSGRTWSNFVGALTGGRFVGGLGQPQNTDAHCDNQVGCVFYTVTASSGVSNAFHRVRFDGLTRRST
jgi:hypothetical protein